MSASLRTAEAQLSPDGIVRPRTAPFHTVERELCFASQRKGSLMSEKGYARRFNRAPVPSAMHPTTHVSLHRTPRREEPISARVGHHPQDL